MMDGLDSKDFDSLRWEEERHALASSVSLRTGNGWVVLSAPR
jgi:hypothetical protein